MIDDVASVRASHVFDTSYFSCLTLAANPSIIALNFDALSSTHPQYTDTSNQPTKQATNQTTKPIHPTMKTVSILIAALCLLQAMTTTNAFVTPSRSSSSAVVSAKTTSSTQLFFFGGAKDDGSPGDYVCKDCGYVFTKGPKAWAALPDSYGCPPCGAPKRRFSKVAKGSASGKVDVKKSWF